MINESRAIKASLGIVGTFVGTFAALTLPGGLALAETATVPTSARRVRDTDVVVAVDRATRHVRLRNADGETRTVAVPPDLKAFDTLKPGDQVDVEYDDAIAVSLMPPDTKAGVSENLNSARPPAAAGAGAGAGRTIMATVEVVGIDEVLNKVTFKGPKGSVQTVTAYDPAVQRKLAALHPGQMVQITYREAIATSIKPIG